jgi:hypothetical protein
MATSMRGATGQATESSAQCDGEPRDRHFDSSTATSTVASGTHQRPGGRADPPDASRSAAAAFAYGIGKGGRRVENDAREKAAGERMRPAPLQLGSGGWFVASLGWWSVYGVTAGRRRTRVVLWRSRRRQKDTKVRPAVRQLQWSRVKMGAGPGFSRIARDPARQNLFAAQRGHPSKVNKC